MKSTTIEIEQKIDELMACLDEDSQHIEESLSQLNKLRSLVIKRDDSSLSKLLKVIQSNTDSHLKTEIKRQNVLKELANALELSMEQLTLSVLEANLPQKMTTQLIIKKEKLTALAKELKKEYYSTALLISECARFNNLLLNNIFDIGKTGAVYYNSNGTTKQQTDMAFVNLQY